jgi:hypothetical protein
MPTVCKEDHSSNLEPTTKKLKSSSGGDDENRKEATPNESDDKQQQPNGETGVTATKSEEANITANNSKSDQTANEIGSQVPIEIQNHEYVHLFFDEAGNQLHQYSSSKLEQHFFDANGQIILNFDPSLIQKHGLLRREFYHVRHSQIPSSLSKHYLSREDLEKNSVDMYKNTVERVQQPGMPTYGHGGYADSYYSPSYMYPSGAETSSRGFYYHTMPSSPHSNYTASMSSNRMETVNGKGTEQNMKSDDNDTKKEEEHSGAGRDNDHKATSPSKEGNIHPVVTQNQSQSIQVPMQQYSSYSHFSNGSSPPKSSDTRFMYDQGQMYRPDMHPMNQLHGYPAQRFHMESSVGRDSYHHYQQYHPAYPPYDMRTSPQHANNVVSGTVSSSSELNLSQSHGVSVSTINDNDVLCGRGGTTNQHIGNRKFRTLVKQHQRSYLKCKKKEKPAVASKIVKMIREMNPPGRFLKQVKSDGVSHGVWCDIGDARATEKVSQALREGAPTIRKAMEEGGEDWESPHTTKVEDSVVSNGGANDEITNLSIRPESFKVADSTTSDKNRTTRE